MKNLVTSTISAVNPDAPTEPDAQLMGGALDSLDIVELMVRLEEAVEDTYGVPAELVGNPDVIAPGGPLETVGSLVRYLEGQ